MLDAHTPILRRVTTLSRVRGRSIPRIPQARLGSFQRDSFVVRYINKRLLHWIPGLVYRWSWARPDDKSRVGCIPAPNEVFQRPGQVACFQVSRRESTPYLSVPRPRLGSLLTKGRRMGDATLVDDNFPFFLSLSLLSSSSSSFFHPSVDNTFFFFFFV